MTPKRSRREKEKRIYETKVRPFIVERAGGQCEEEISGIVDGLTCYGQGTDPHHIHGRRGKLLIDPMNIILLCHYHHVEAEAHLSTSRPRHDAILERKYGN